MFRVRRQSAAIPFPDFERPGLSGLQRGFENHVRRLDAGAGDFREAGLIEHICKLLLPGLRAGPTTDFLRKRRWRADDRREAIEDLTQQVQILLHVIFGQRFDKHECSVAF